MILIQPPAFKKAERHMVEYGAAVDLIYKQLAVFLRIAFAWRKGRADIFCRMKHIGRDHRVIRADVRRFC